MRQITAQATGYPMRRPIGSTPRCSTCCG